ncbi:ATP-binding protein [Nakamurella sp. GG22]
MKRLSIAVDRRRQLDPARLRMLDDTLAVLAQDYQVAHDQRDVGDASSDYAPNHDALIDDDSNNASNTQALRNHALSDHALRGDALTDDVLTDTGVVFGLDEPDRDLVLISAAADLDANIALAYGLLRGGTAAGRVSVGLALELIGLSSLSPDAGARLGASGVLRRSGLLEADGAGPWLSREIWCPERVVNHLRQWNAPDPAIAAHVTDAVPLPLPGSSIVATALEAGTALVWVHSPVGAAGSCMAAAAVQQINVRALVVTVPVEIGGPNAVEFLRTALREAALLGSCLLLDRAERLGGGDNAPLARLLAAPVVPVIAVSQQPIDPAWVTELRPLLIDAPRLDPESRERLWHVVTGTELPAGALTGLRLSPEGLLQTARYAADLATGDRGPDADEVRRAARVVGGVNAPATDVGLDDLVLPEDVAAGIERLVGWARHRDDLITTGLVPRAGGRGGGITALFSGSPGTGKTLAAHVVAAELGMDIIRVDLSAIVDKYIGEAQKNLEEVFHRAESLNVVLFFDEADALFGKRSEVKDAHDRYANQEVAYLLQRMELFDGITILATNLRGNLDPAFSRRLSFIVHFPDPDARTRERLWRVHLDRLGGQDPADPVDPGRLARHVELTGGDIRNIVVAAGYDAAIDGARPGMRHVLAAATREYSKLGRRIPAGGL